MLRIAQVATSVALDRNFDYLVPAELDAALALGARVVVPFGRSRTTGIVVGFIAESKHAQLKSIISLTDSRPILDPALLDLARWIGEYYCAPLEQVLKAMLPAAVRKPGAQARSCLQATATRPRTEDAAETPKPGQKKDGLTPRQLLVMERLWAGGPQPAAALCRDLGITTAPLRVLARNGWVTLADVEQPRIPESRRTLLPTQPMALSPDQTAALAEITQVMAAPAGGVVLLHGVTGSGKTEIYLQAIAQALAAGRGAIVLVPEIALTPQTTDRFVSRFGEEVAVLHSHLSEGERYDEWHRIRSGVARIVVGARSAIFAPVQPLGVIVVDEEHEPSYKQEDAPRYNARDVAVMRGRLEHCAVVLGSATPALESWMNAQKGKYRLASLPVRVDDRKMPSIRIVDMRVNAERTGHVSVFSKELLDAMHECLSRSEQTILFLNRRGFATTLICPKCGYAARCDFCSVSVTYHRQDERLRCHLCGVTRPVPAACPECKDPAFKFSGFGTQRVETIVAKCFPKAKVARMDTDTTSGKGAHDRILGDFRAGKTDILIGTQMIAKGLDFPNVTLVGVVNADLSLHMPDFRAGERTYQLLAQVSGRAGRGIAPGTVVIQTYTPHHPAMQAVRRGDFVGFCDQELEFRKELHYPPFQRMACITFRGVSEERVGYSAKTVADLLRTAVGDKGRVSEAIPSPIARMKGAYRFQILLRSTSVSAVSGSLRHVLKQTRLPAGVKCTVDIDALHMM